MVCNERVSVKWQMSSNGKGLTWIDGKSCWGRMTAFTRYGYHCCLETTIPLDGTACLAFCTPRSRCGFRCGSFCINTKVKQHIKSSDSRWSMTRGLHWVFFLHLYRLQRITHLHFQSTRDDQLTLRCSRSQAYSSTVTTCGALIGRVSAYNNSYVITNGTCIELMLKQLKRIAVDIHSVTHLSMHRRGPDAGVNDDTLGVNPTLGPIILHVRRFHRPAIWETFQ